MGQPNPPRRHVITWIAITVLLLASLVGTLWVPFYARTTPKLGDFPFFYWYQLIWVPIVALLSWLAYLLIRGRPGAPGTDAATATEAGTGSADQGGGKEQ
jgi:hypothetical protein